MNALSGIAAAMTLLFSVAAIAAPVYQWKDAEGNVHFSDRPPEHVPDVQQMPLQTDMLSERPYVEHPYSIQKQVEFFQSQQEKQQRMWLEQQMARQQMESASRETGRLVMPPVDAIPPIVPVPRYQSLYYPYHSDRRRHPYSHPRHRGEGASLNVLDTGDHHRMHLNLNFYNRLSPELYHRLRYWNLRR